jgi:hypothetical protein
VGQTACSKPGHEMAESRSTCERRSGMPSKADLMEIEFYSKFNTADPDGLRCCHASDMLHAIECRRT